MTDRNNEHEPERGHENDYGRGRGRENEYGYGYERGPESENENENEYRQPHQYGYGQAPRHGAWEPVPHGGEYEPDATAFVQLPPDMDMMDAPLAAPGHGYVPPMIVPLTPLAATDPGATGIWRIPTEPAESAESSEPGGQGARGASGTHPAPGAQTVVWPEPPAPTPLPASSAQPAHDPSATAQWHFPDEPSLAGTGQWTIPVAEGELPEESGEFTTSALIEQWGSTPPATLPGGAPAPWAHQFPEPAQEPLPDPSQDPAREPLPDPSPEAHAPTPEAHAPTPEAHAPAPEGHAPAPEHAPLAADRPANALDAHHDVHHDVHHGVHPHEAPDAPDAPDASEVPVLPEALEAPSAAHAPVVPDVHDVAEAGAMPAPASVPESQPNPHPVSEPRPESPAAPTAPESLPEELVAVEPLAEAVPESHGMSEAAALAELAGAPEAELAPGTGTGTGAETAALSGTLGTPEPTDAPDPTGTAGTTDTPAPPGASGTDRGTDLAIDLGTDPGDATPDAEPTPAVTIAPDLEHPRASYVLRVNGADRPVTEAWVGESLLYVLRERLGLAGAKDGCSQGECGACNVQVDGRLVASCLVPAATAAGSEVRTVEGLATDGEPSDVQRALAECGAVQCGFCIPGMAMTVHDLLEGNHAPTELETRQALCGNLCRCSGYRGVLDAVKDVVAGREAAGALAEEARIPHQAPPGAGSAKPPHTHDGGMA
ncbi:2Fe-2S iron-sulfur cluster-binding protein [Streptomyces hundungensis]|uniref:2Fe-2S iron-sulfur cluster-binding protein n=1 Tax=Streptomyces hundungensis TaxID=1077946 RepID=UPI0033DE0DF0